MTTQAIRIAAEKLNGQGLHCTQTYTRAHTHTNTGNQLTEIIYEQVGEEGGGGGG